MEKIAVRNSFFAVFAAMLGLILPHAMVVGAAVPLVIWLVTLLVVLAYGKSADERY